MSTADNGKRDRSAAKREKKKDDTPGSLEDYILAANRMVNAVASDVLNRRGLSLAEWAALRTVVDGPNVPVSKTRKAVGISKGELRATFDALQRKGLVTLKGAAGDDQAQTVSATANGTNLLNTLARDFDELRSKFLDTDEKGPKRLALSIRLANQLRKGLSTPAEAEAKAE